MVEREGLEPPKLFIFAHNKNYANPNVTPVVVVLYLQEVFVINLYYYEQFYDNLDKYK